MSGLDDWLCVYDMTREGIVLHTSGSRRLLRAGSSLVVLCMSLFRVNFLLYLAYALGIV